MGAEQPGGLPPEEHIGLVVEAVLLRAELKDLRDERQDDFDRLATMRQWTMEDIDNATDLQSIAIYSYTTARIQNAEALEILDDGLALMDRAIGLLESGDDGLALAVAYAVDRTRERLEEMEDYIELTIAFEVLRDIVQDPGGR